MTTVIGLAHPETNMAILAADRQSTLIGENKQIAEKNLRGRKIWQDKNQWFAFGHSGMYDKTTDELVGQMLSGDIDFQKVIAEGVFPELRDSNYTKMGNKLPDLDNLSSFLLVTRFDNQPKLYTCWPLGAVEERVVTYIGSGSSRVQKYFEAHNTMCDAKDYASREGNTTRQDALRISLEALRYAQDRDIYSSGLDLVVLTPEKIVDHTTDLKDDFGKRLRKIQNAHK